MNSDFTSSRASDDTVNPFLLDVGSDAFYGDEFDYEPDLDLDDMGLGLELAIADLVNDLQTAPLEPEPELVLEPELVAEQEIEIEPAPTREPSIAQDVLRYLLTSDVGGTDLADSSLEGAPLWLDAEPSDPELTSSALSSAAIAATSPPERALLDNDLDGDLSDADLLDADLDGIDLDGELLLDLPDEMPDGMPDAMPDAMRSPVGLAGQPADGIGAPAGATQLGNPQPWYLGLDVGTTGISAVLLNRTTCEQHPVYWLEIKFPAATADGVQAPIGTPEKTFRLPAAGYLPVSTETSSAQQSAATASFGDRPSSPDPQVLGGLTPIRIAPLAADAAFHLRQATYPSRLLVRDFKPYLRLGIPYYSLPRSQWEPVIQWSDLYAVPLSVFHQALRALLATLTSPLPNDPAAQTSVLTCGAVGLDDGEFQRAMQQLAGVIVSYPANWSDTYSFNLREAILAARLVAHPEQIFFVAETVATLLSGMQSANGQPITLPYSLSQRLDLHNHDWQGGTLVINAGATLSELALVNLPSQLQNLTHADFTHRTVNYGGNALDQDIICQLIYPAWVRQLHQSAVGAADANDASYTFQSGMQVQSGAFTDGWNWQAADVAPDPWLSLGWDTLTLPTVGEPDLSNRYRLQQCLQRSPLGLSLIEAARQLKLSLQHQDRASMTLGAHTLMITRQDLGSRVLLMYIQRLNRELNALLNQTAIPVLAVNQVICSGGTASLAAIARWLRQKFPNATITQDTYTTAAHDNALLACSRVAYGLATLPLHPQVLDRPRQQYSDYFLLMEILRAFPDQAVTVNQLMQTLERRGIDTESCQHHILALLEGRLPPGLLPTEKDQDILTPDSMQNPDYQALQGASLFFKQDAQTYLPNHQQWQLLRRYLDTLLATTHQKLAEPLIADLVRNEG